MLARNHAFPLLAMENDCLAVALVAGSTNRSLQITTKFFSNIIGGGLRPAPAPQPPGSAVPVRVSLMFDL